jgi:hypothetical protein
LVVKRTVETRQNNREQDKDYENESFFH